MPHTPQQRSFIEHLRSSSSSIALKARAGSGKTTTMVDGAKEANLAGLAVAFNKLIAEELAKRMPETMLCKTMNSLGHGAWGRHLGKRLTLNTEKIYQIASDLLPGDLKKDYQGEFMRLVNLFKSSPALPAGAPGGSSIGDDELILDLVEEHDLNFGKLRKDLIVDLTRKMMIESIKRGFQGEIDFSDQLYLPVVYRSRFEQYANVMVDEAQDLSPLQHAMISRCMGASSRAVIVGDPNQAIYGWRGAASNSFDLLTSQFKCETMPLTVSWRCAKKIIEEAQKFVDDIEYAPTAIDGEVLDEVGFSKRSIARGDWIICRNNRPLVVAFFNLAKANIPAKIRGKAIGQNLAKLVDKISESMPLRCADFLKPLIEYRQEWVSRYRDLGKEAKAQEILDKTEVLQVICQNMAPTAWVAELKQRILAMFDDSGGAPVTLSTIHKAKGLEADTVHFLDSALIPSTWAKGDALSQEYNLAYVGVTRAKKALSYIRTEDKHERD